MDTISQESESGSFSFLALAALIVGLIAAVLGAVALVKVSALNKTLSEQTAVAGRVDALETQVRTAVTASEAATQRIAKVASDTNAAFTQVGNLIGEVRTGLQDLETKVSTPAPVSVASASNSSSGPPVPGGNYTIRSGDTGTKIATAAGVSLQDLMRVNPDVNWNRLQVGQVIRLPQK